jgi:hypothetical protein
MHSVLAQTFSRIKRVGDLSTTGVRHVSHGRVSYATYRTLIKYIRHSDDAAFPSPVDAYKLNQCKLNIRIAAQIVLIKHF